MSVTSVIHRDQWLKMSASERSGMLQDFARRSGIGGAHVIRSETLLEYWCRRWREKVKP